MPLLKNITLKHLPSSVRFFSQQFRKEQFYKGKNYFHADEIRIVGSSPSSRLEEAKQDLLNATKSQMNYINGTVDVLQKRQEGAHWRYWLAYEDAAENLDQRIEITKDGKFATPSTSLYDDFVAAKEDFDAVKSSWVGWTLFHCSPLRNQWKAKYETAKIKFEQAEQEEKGSGYKQRPSELLDASLVENVQQSTAKYKCTGTLTLS